MHLDTTLGPLPLPERGCILPHEHVFVDLRTSVQPGYSEADPEAVVRLMAPEIERARAAGVVAIVEPGGIGVGRRVDILLPSHGRRGSLWWRPPGFTASRGCRPGCVRQARLIWRSG
jgi:hypothetical protein